MALSKRSVFALDGLRRAAYLAHLGLTHTVYPGSFLHHDNYDAGHQHNLYRRRFPCLPHGLYLLDQVPQDAPALFVTRCGKSRQFPGLGVAFLGGQLIPEKPLFLWRSHREERRPVPAMITLHS